MGEYSMNERHTCRLMGLARSTQRHWLRKPGGNMELWQQLRDLRLKRILIGYPGLQPIVAREGTRVNRKKVYRLYREEQLAMPVRHGRRARGDSDTGRKQRCHPVTTPLPPPYSQYNRPFRLIFAPPACYL